jgi:hypothetical protein
VNSKLPSSAVCRSSSPLRGRGLFALRAHASGPANRVRGRRTTASDAGPPSPARFARVLSPRGRGVV